MNALDIEAVIARMPFRWPTVLVDRIVDCVPGKSIKALKNVTMNEPFFAGHFPDYPVMPGVLVLEALTQVSGVLAVASGLCDAAGAPAVSFVGVDACRFKRQVIPGDTLALESQWSLGDAGRGSFAVRACVGDELAAEATLMVTVTRT